MLSEADVERALSGDLPCSTDGGRRTVIAADRLGEVVALFCLRVSKDQRTWTTDTVLGRRSSDAGWQEELSGGTTFGALRLQEAATWTDHWFVGGDTVACDLETSPGRWQRVGTVSGFCAPSVGRVHEADEQEPRSIVPVLPLQAFVIVSLMHPVGLIGERRDGSQTATWPFTRGPRDRA